MGEILLSNRDAFIDEGVIGEKTWLNLMGRLAKAYPERSPSLIGRGLDQSFGFLRAVALSGEGLSPSPLVDDGWHELITDTPSYFDVSGKIAGAYIHHLPYAEPLSPDQSRDALERTVEAMEANDIAVDMPLWLGAAACSVDCEGNCRGDLASYYPLPR